MIATIVLSLTIGIAFIVQTLNTVACRALACVRDPPRDTVVEMTEHKSERPTLRACNNELTNMTDTEVL
jgi:hypothetical protein